MRLRLGFYIFILYALFVFAMPTMAAQEAAADIASDNPAFSAVNFAIEKGYLTKNEDGNFRPAGLINKFDAAKILAALAGLGAEQDEGTQATAAQNRGNYQDLLSYYAKTYTKWDDSANEAIALLIDAGVLSVDDLRLFVVIRPNGVEGVRALTKEEAAAFFVKAAGREAAAAAAPVENVLKDDKSIAVKYRPFVYYLRAQNAPLFTTDGAFSPKTAITRVQLAALIDVLVNAAEYDAGVSIETAAAPSGDSAAAEETAAAKPPDIPERQPAPTAQELGLTITGRLTQVRITADASYITIADGIIETEYKVIEERVDVRALLLGSYVRVYLDSYKHELVCGVEVASDIAAKG